MYVPQNFKIASTEGSEVQVYIWGANGFWRHELFFRVEKEDGEYYIVPSPDTEVSQFNLFDPCVKVVKNSNFDKAIMKKE